MKSEFLRITVWTVAAACVVYVLGWFINVMDVDASQYAAMTREMLEKGDFLHFTDRGREYLDKPPLLLWTSGLSMRLLGINNVAYRVPAFIATLLALYSTYRLATVFYSVKTGYLAACILATTQAVFLINHDVRTDTWLMCWFVFSMWQFAEHLQSGKPIPLLLAFAGTGFAMLAKGPIGLIAPAMGIFMHLLLTRNWSSMIHVKWFAGLIIVAVVLLPMAYGLYTQFDLHPEKMVNGETGVSGLRFFFWTQSFGRITGESVWANDSGPFFLSHTTLWAFAPWSLLLVMGLVSEARSLFRHLTGKRKKKEFLIVFGFLLPFIALSSSRYQLPHYAFIVYPLGAVITARYIIACLHAHDRSKAKWVFHAHRVLMILTLAFVTFIVIFAFPARKPEAIVLAVLAVAAFGFVHYGIQRRYAIIRFTVITAVFINLMLNVIFYPELLKYQSGSTLGKMALKDGATSGTVYSYKGPWPYSLDFYAQTITTPESRIEAITTKKNIWVVTSDEGLAELRIQRPDLAVIGEAFDYSVSQLTLQFLDPRSRPSVITKAYLLKL